MDNAGIKSYVLSLLEQVNSPKDTEEYGILSLSLWRVYKGLRCRATGSLPRSTPGEHGSRTNLRHSFATVQSPKMTSGYRSCLIFTSSMDFSSSVKRPRTVTFTLYVCIRVFHWCVARLTVTN